MTQRWGAELSGTVTDVARRLSRLAEAVGMDWPDQRGREWLDRAGQLHRDLMRQAAAAAEWDTRASEFPGAGGIAVRPGVRLGGTAGSRVDDRPGVRIAELPAE